MVAVVTIVTVVMFMSMFILCIALTGANANVDEDDYLQEKYLKEWKENNDSRKTKKEV